MQLDHEMGNVGTENDASSRCDEENTVGDSYSMAAFTKMNAFRKRGQLCDVVIKVGGREFLAHRVVLAATSDYFDAMFSNGMAESAQLEVELKSISPDIMDALLDYVYTGQVKVTMDNVQDLLPAASLVQMEGVKTACSNFLLAEVDASNVLGIRRFAELHNCAELEKFARNYAAHNFELVADYEEFLCLNHEELLDLVAREDLHIDSEESVYKAVMRWVYHQATERAAHLAALLAHIRLPVMSVRFLTDVVDKDALIRQSLECRDLVDDAKRFHLRPDLRHEMRERRYRQRDCGDEYLVVIGGFGSDQNPSDSVEMFNPRTSEWSELPDLPISYRYVAACSLDTCVYVIGGFDGRERLNTVCLLDIAQREDGWRWLTPMHYKRGLSAACTHKGLIYVCGGFDGQSRLRSLEVYHPKIDEWRILEDMTTSREGAGLVVVDDTLYCLGGYDGFHLLNSMEAFDLRRGTWSVCKPMYMRRSGAGCALLGDTIYVCGGYGGAEGRGPLHLDTVEAYNVRLQHWTLVTSMNVPRCYVGACPLAGKIYVAAGYNGSRLLDTVESYDPVENVWWLHDESRMNHERCDTGMCVVRFLPCSGLATSGNTSARVPASASSVTINRGVTQTSNADTTSSSAQHNPLAPGRLTTVRHIQDPSGYRIPMLPVTPNLRGGLTNLFRSGTLSHRPYNEMEPSSVNPATFVARSGMLPFRNVSIPSAFRGPGRFGARSFQVGSLHRHPDLPSRHQFPFSVHGFLHSGHRGLGSRIGQRFYPRQPINSAHGLGIPPVCSEMPRPTNTSITECNPMALPSRGTHVEHPSTCPVSEPSNPDTNVFGLNQYISPEDPPLSTMESHDAVDNYEPSEQHAPLSLRSMSPRPRLSDSLEPISESHVLDPNFQSSSSSSPTLLSRMYHSAPESGPSQTRHSELFHSAEALNANLLDYHRWLNRSAVLLNNDRSGSESGSELNFSRVESQTAGFFESQREEQNRVLGFSDPFDITHPDALFSYLRLEDTLLDDQDQDGASDGSEELEDAVLPSPTSSIQPPVPATGSGDYVNATQHTVSSSLLVPDGVGQNSEVSHPFEVSNHSASIGAPPSGPLFFPVGSSGDSNSICPCEFNSRLNNNHIGDQSNGTEQRFRRIGAERLKRRPSIQLTGSSDAPVSDKGSTISSGEPTSIVSSNNLMEAQASSVDGCVSSLNRLITDPVQFQDIQYESATSSDQPVLSNTITCVDIQSTAQGGPDSSFAQAREQHSVTASDILNDADILAEGNVIVNPPAVTGMDNIGDTTLSTEAVEVPSSVDMRSDGEGEEDYDNPGTTRGNPAIGQ